MVRIDIYEFPYATVEDYPKDDSIEIEMCSIDAYSVNLFHEQHRDSLIVFYKNEDGSVLINWPVTKGILKGINYDFIPLSFYFKYSIK